MGIQQLYTKEKYFHTHFGTFMVFAFSFLFDLYPQTIQLYAQYIEQRHHDHASTSCDTYKHIHASHYLHSLKSHYIASLQNNTCVLIKELGIKKL